MGKLKNKVMDVAKKNVVLRVATKKSLKTYRTLRYFGYYLTNKVSDKTIVFESFMGRAFSDSQKALYKEMLKDEFFKDYTFVWAFKGHDKYKYLEENANTKVIEYGSKEFMKYMAKAKWWITNSRLPEYLIKKKSQKYIQ